MKTKWRIKSARDSIRFWNHRDGRPGGVFLSGTELEMMDGSIWFYPHNGGDARLVQHGEKA